MADLKPCPFCNSNPDSRVDEDAGELVSCLGPMCPMGDIELSREEWNSRPIEDALRAEAKLIRQERDEARRDLARALGEEE